MIADDLRAGAHALWSLGELTLPHDLAMVVLASVISFFGGLFCVAAHAEYRKDQRFLRVMLVWDGHTIYERVYFNPAPVT